MEYSASGSPTAAYTYGNGQRLTYENQALKDGNPNKTSTYLYDGRGSVTNLVSNGGQNIVNYTYDANGKASADKASYNAFAYNGEAHDLTLTDMQYLRARYYEADTARFTQRDTYLGKLIRPVSLNQYTYVENNPLAYTDPTGHKKKSPNVIDILYNALGIGKNKKPFNPLAGLPYYNQIASSWNNSNSGKSINIPKWSAPRQNNPIGLQNGRSWLSVMVEELLNTKVRQSCNEVKKIQTQDLSKGFTFSSGQNLNIQLGFIDIEGTVGVVIDGKGNFGVFYSHSKGVTTSPTGISYTKVTSFTNASNIRNLEGPSRQGGVNGSIKIEGVPIAGGITKTRFRDYETGEKYDGTGMEIGLGIGPSPINGAYQEVVTEVYSIEDIKAAIKGLFK